MISDIVRSSAASCHSDRTRLKDLFSLNPHRAHAPQCIAYTGHAVHFTLRAHNCRRLSECLFCVMAFASPTEILLGLVLAGCTICAAAGYLLMRSRRLRQRSQKSLPSPPKLLPEWIGTFGGHMLLLKKGKVRILPQSLKRVGATGATIHPPPQNNSGLRRQPQHGYRNGKSRASRKLETTSTLGIVLHHCRPYETLHAI